MSLKRPIRFTEHNCNLVHGHIFSFQSHSRPAKGTVLQNIPGLAVKGTNLRSERGHKNLPVLTGEKENGKVKDF